MVKPLVSDALWQRIAPLLPPPKTRRFRWANLPVRSDTSARKRPGDNSMAGKGEYGRASTAKRFVS